MESSYRCMRVFVLFDLPAVTKGEKRNYVKFRKQIIEDGFIMLQYSIYTRFCRNFQDAKKHIQRIEDMAPRDGNIRILSITEHQFEQMVNVVGECSETEKIVKRDYLVVIE